MERHTVKHHGGGGGGGGLLPLGIQRRGSEPKTASCGVILIDISIASIDKFSKKLLCIFKFYYSFKLQTS